MDFVDDLQRIVSLPTLPQRIVSLVPGLTETLFVFGAGERVVGVIDYCTHPPEGVAGVTKVGGTKDPRLEVILQLAPDLVICNEEENRREDFLWLADHNLPLYVNSPRTVADGIALLNKLGSFLGCQSPRAPPARAKRLLDDRVA